MSKAINGTFGRVWVNGEDYGSVKEFEAKVTLEWEPIPEPEELGPEYKYMGYEIEGTVVGTKMDSRFPRLYGDGILSGDIPDVEIVARVADPQAAGHERVALYGVVFDEIALAKFASNTVVEEEIPFKAKKYKYLDMI